MVYRMIFNQTAYFGRGAIKEIPGVARSHGFTKAFIVTDPVLLETGTVKKVTDVLDEAGMPSMDLSVNPNGSVMAIEGTTSPDGRVLGKMGHTERNGYGLYKNVPGNTFQPLIEGGVSYFTE